MNVNLQKLRILPSFVLVLGTLACGNQDNLGMIRQTEADYQDVAVTSPVIEQPTVSETAGTEIDVPAAPVAASAPAPTPAPDPVAAPDVCALIADVAGSCPNFGYDCAAHTPEESWCFYDTLLTMSNPCLVFNELPRCNGPQPSEYAVGSCMVQECFGVSNAQVCYDNTAIQCDFIY